ncbi:uncharacterized protein LOC134537467 [Bacillus rossius redtenbacheri]|uniref:uncharacterized protein LOC134537467 n=1 Tax=Bacillus rossius redtenbacheri TaxID=93214 RepID=UPI002FDD0B00
MQRLGEKGSPAPDSFSEEQLQVYVKQMLGGQLFRGNYRERRHVPQLGGYRDVVELCGTERDFRDALEAAQERMLRHYGPGRVWTGITIAGPTDQPCLHVRLEDVAFGHYWFLLKSVKFTGPEVVLRLKCLRPLGEAEAPAEGRPGPERDTDWSAILEEWKHALSRGAKAALAVGNVRQAVVFLAVVAAGLLAGAVHSVRHLGDFSLRLVRELSGLVRALTPLALALVDFLAKCVGGLYLLLALVFRGRGPAPPPPRRPAIKYGRADGRW